MLRHGAAPAHAHHIDDIEPQPVEHLRRGPAHGEGVVGQARFGAFADAGHVEHDEAAFGQPLRQRGDRFDIGADPVEEQDRWMLRRFIEPPVGDAQAAASRFDHLVDGGGFILGRCGQTTILLDFNMVP